jgi:DNA-binding NtrC family response regulator
MNGDDCFALVPKATGALERIVPGAQRVISGMVSDTLALANSAIRGRLRPPRIVIIDDEPSVVDLLERWIPSMISDATILGFVDADLAWQELMREDPDLFITDACHPRLGTDEILHRLTARRAEYPIFVISGNSVAREKLQAGCIGSDLKVTFMAKPFKLDELRQHLDTHLGLVAQLGSPTFRGNAP